MKQAEDNKTIDMWAVKKTYAITIKYVAYANYTIDAHTPEEAEAEALTRKRPNCRFRQATWYLRFPQQCLALRFRWIFHLGLRVLQSTLLFPNFVQFFAQHLHFVVAKCQQHTFRVALISKRLNLSPKVCMFPLQTDYCGLQ